MKTPLIIVLVIVAGMLGFLTIYSQQQAPVALVTQVQGAEGGNAAAALPSASAGNVAAPAAGGDSK